MPQIIYVSFYLLCSYVKEARKKADPYVAQAVDAASRGLDFAKQTAIDLQAKVHFCTAEHLWHETITYKNSSGGREVPKSKERCGEGSARIRLQV